MPTFGQYRNHMQQPHLKLLRRRFSIRCPLRARNCRPPLLVRSCFGCFPRISNTGSNLGSNHPVDACWLSTLVYIHNVTNTANAGRACHARTAKLVAGVVFCTQTEALLPHHQFNVSIKLKTWELLLNPMGFTRAFTCIDFVWSCYTSGGGEQRFCGT